MGNAKFSDDFKRDAVHQIVDQGYPVAEVSQRLGVSTHSLYTWVKRFSKQVDSSGEDECAAEIRRLKRELARVTEERDILKNCPGLWPACARWKQSRLCLCHGGWRPFAYWRHRTPLKNVVHGLMRT